ncbi:hypothetical protein M378DRAFT_199348 [Amanita muscaria Koide BX008]|uniref:Uncharacterized protein n=1 Tax=Amanita muscaria (strain Koide BX008) TaxID=946122 RepID=A0A0C2T663_AMAMK|nr:hypothetical protein M378DRAFT_199348 [Amanita muscaria Koide BX008]
MNFVNRYGKCKCDCLKYCQGGKIVCYETHRRHEPYRKAAQDAAMQKLLQDIGPLTKANTSSGVGKKKSKKSRVPKGLSSQRAANDNKDYESSTQFDNPRGPSLERDENFPSPSRAISPLDYIDEPITAHFDDPSSLDHMSSGATHVDIRNEIMPDLRNRLEEDGSPGHTTNDNQADISDEMDMEPPEDEDAVRDDGNDDDDGGDDNGVRDNGGSMDDGSDEPEGEDGVGDGDENDGEDGVGVDGDNEAGSLDDEYDVDIMMSTNIDNEIEFDIQQTPRSPHDRLAQSQEIIDAIRDAQFKDDMNDEMLSRMMNPPRSCPNISYLKQVSIRVFDELRHGGP